MKKIVISGSSKLQSECEYWVNYFKNNEYKVLDYPKFDGSGNVYSEFFTNLENCDIHFAMNEDKNGISGYIGANTFSEISYSVIRNLIHNDNREIYILKMPSEDVSCFEEIKFFLEKNWIKLFDKEELK